MKSIGTAKQRRKITTIAASANGWPVGAQHVVAAEDRGPEPSIEGFVGNLALWGANECRVPLGERRRRQLDAKLLPVWKDRRAWNEVLVLGYAGRFLPALEKDEPEGVVHFELCPGCTLEEVAGVLAGQERLCEVHPEKQTRDDWHGKNHRPDGVDRHLRRPDNRLFTSPLACHCLSLLRFGGCVLFHHIRCCFTLRCPHVCEYAAEVLGGHYLPAGERFQHKIQKHPRGDNLGK